MAERLRSRQAELEQALLARVYGIADPAETEDPGYLDGFRSAAGAAVDFTIATLASGEAEEPPVPPVFLQQARLAARNGVRLDVVVRRYAAGQAILVDFLIAEGEQQPELLPVGLRAPFALLSSAFDRLLVCVGDEYAREAARSLRSSRERSRVERVERLLAGEPVGSGDLDYPLDGWHLGLVAEGVDARDAIRDLARDVDRRLLVVEPRVGTVWAWLGGRAEIDGNELTKRIRRCGLEMKLALGEEGRGAGGWRLSHRQALAVLPFAEGSPVALARYAEKGVLASIQKDQVLVESLQKLYLEPLADDRHGEKILAETLRAYFDAAFSASSAASALHVHRQTVTSRLRTVEERLGRPITECSLELTLALMLGAEGCNNGMVEDGPLLQQSYSTQW